MKFLSKKSIVGTVLSAIILGSVASGVWQYIIDPLVLKSSKAILNIATLGMESFKNDLYRQVAKGFHEGASSALYSQINGLVGIAAIIFSLNLAKRSKELIQKNSELLEEIQRIEAGEEKALATTQELRERITNLRIERLMKVVYALVALAIIYFSAQFVTSKSDRYVNSAITNYFQLKRTIFPYITQNELLVLDSRFSQIQSVADYKALISQMSATAKQNNVKEPNFEVWE